MSPKDYVYYTDEYFEGLQWRYERAARLGGGPEYTTQLFVQNVGEVRHEGGPWMPAATTLADQIKDRVDREVGPL